MAGREGLDLSFSGLKTALRTAGWPPAPATSGAPTWRRPTSAPLVRSLVSRTMRALEVTGRDTLAVVGGVAANGVLRAALEQECARAGVRLALAPLALCSDNAAMIASAARFCPALPYPEYLARDAYATA